MKTVPTVRVADASDAVGLPELAEEIQLAMSDIAGVAREGLLAMSVAAGMAVMQAMFEAEIAQACGPKGRRDASRAAVRHGTGRGSVTLGGRKVAVTRPRARTTDGHEVTLSSYAHFAAEEVLTRGGVGADAGRHATPPPPAASTRTGPPRVLNSTTQPPPFSATAPRPSVQDVAATLFTSAALRVRFTAKAPRSAFVCGDRRTDRRTRAAPLPSPGSPAPDRRLAHTAEQLALESLVSPARVIPRHPHYQGGEGVVDGWSSGSVGVGPSSADEAAMPAQDRVRGDQAMRSQGSG